MNLKTISTLVLFVMSGVILYVKKKLGKGQRIEEYRNQLKNELDEAKSRRDRDRLNSKLRR